MKIAFTKTRLSLGMPGPKETIEFTLVDVEREATFLVFENADEVDAHIRNLIQLRDNYPEKSEPRIYMMYNQGVIDRDKANEILETFIKHENENPKY